MNENKRDLPADKKDHPAPRAWVPWWAASPAAWPVERPRAPRWAA